VVDTIAYTRDGNAISGTGRKSGNVSLREKIAVSEDWYLTLMYSVFVGTREVANGIAVFQAN
jgi:hypothetical protein